MTLRVEWYAAGQTDLERIYVQRLDRAAQLAIGGDDHRRGESDDHAGEDEESRRVRGRHETRLSLRS